MPIRHLLPAAALLVALTAPSPAAAAPFAPGHVVVRYRADASRAERRDVQEATGTSFESRLPGGTRKLGIEDGDSVRATVAQLSAQPDVEYAVPDYKLSAAQGGAPVPFIPNDPGRDGNPGGWRELQWNFEGPFSVNAPQAWALSRQTPAPGGRGAVVAVIDSGVAYRNVGRFKRAPDLYAKRWVAPYDFIDNDHTPLDEDGHGTHVTGTIAQKTNNGVAVTGLAYGVTIMPLRVLDENGDGDGSDFARAVRYAARHGADVINMSVEYDSSLRAADIPDAISAMNYAAKKGVVLVGASGNDGEERVAYPGRSNNAIAVGGSTAGGCLASYSNQGTGLDMVAPGGGEDASAADNDWDREHCDPTRRGRVIYQQTIWKTVSDFQIVGFEGTSEATPHVTATAALVIATGAAGSHPSPTAVRKRIEDTARDLGAPGYDKRYGYGLIDAAAAIAR
jgi:serine protease